MPELTQQEKQLATLMSEISKKCYSAGWMQDTEYVLWDGITSGPRDFGHDHITQEETSIPLDIWKQLFKEKVALMLRDPSSPPASSVRLGVQRKVGDKRVFHRSIFGKRLT